MDPKTASTRFLDLVFSFVPSMALKAVMNLGVPDIIAKAGPQAALSIDEIVAQLPSRPKNDANAAFQLRRLLIVLVRNGVFSESIVAAENGKLQHVYGLTDVSVLLISAPEFSAAPVAQMNLHKAFMAPWHHLHELVLDGNNYPFTIAHGTDMWNFSKLDEETNTILNNSMSSFSNMIIANLVEDYEGFKDINTLVDVGGGVGTSISKIVAAYPNIHGINFDLPQVISTAHQIPGVKHVGGDMFQSVPSADAIFMKTVLHDWDDEACIKILKNCHSALPATGKVLITEIALGDPKDERLETKINYYCDLVMMAHTSGGKERTEEEWGRLTAAAGFARTRFLHFRHCPSHVLVEAHVSH